MKAVTTLAAYVAQGNYIYRVCLFEQKMWKDRDSALML
jgi:hypothetical protein